MITEHPRHIRPRIFRDHGIPTGRIDEARIGNRYFEAVHPLSDGPGNPPPGGGNPYQQGT
jgi:hypothetical protein